MTSNIQRSGKNELAREIISYLADHPSSQDSMEGIVQWWLLERKIKYQTKMVKEALDKLVNASLVDEIRTENKIYYRLNKRK